MTALLPDFSNTRILIIGDIMLDRYWSGSTSRISPEAPVPVVKVGDIENRLGGAANVALNAATLGCQTSLCGIIGEDEAGKTLKSLLQSSKIDDLSVADKQNPTITKLRVMSRHQQLIRMDFEESLQGDANASIVKQLTPIISKFDAVIISDYAKGTVSHPKEIIQLCRQHNVPVFVDPKGHDFERYSNASYITPNRSELEGVVGKTEDLSETFSKAQTLRESLSLDGLLVTLSEKGMGLVRPDAEPFHMPTSAQEVFDVTGAGDTVIATLASAYASGADIQNAMRLANLAAGVAVGKLGTSSVTRDELISAIHADDQYIEKGCIPLSKLINYVKQCQHKGEKVVFTNGCFDILHPGHVNYLKQAAELGDQLIVALNSDASISRLKGQDRPIVPLNERMEVMAALRCVDWVVEFDEDTPLSLITQIQPDILVKGGDYEAEKIVGHKEVTGNGGRVQVLPFVEGCSTTSIIDKIKSLG